MAPWSRVPWCSPPGRGPCRSPKAPAWTFPSGRPGAGRALRASYALPTHLTLIDTTEGFYARPAAEQTTLVGSRDSLEWLGSPDAPTPEPDGTFIVEALRKVAQRLPALAQAPYRSGRSGILDMTPDGRPLLGPAGPKVLPCRGLERDGVQEGAGGRGRSGALGLGWRPEQARA